VRSITGRRDVELAVETTVSTVPLFRGDHSGQMRARRHCAERWRRGRSLPLSSSFARHTIRRRVRREERLSANRFSSSFFLFFHSATCASDSTSRAWPARARLSSSSSAERSNARERARRASKSERCNHRAAISPIRHLLSPLPSSSSFFLNPLPFFFLGGCSAVFGRISRRLRGFLSPPSLPPFRYRMLQCAQVTLLQPRPRRRLASRKR